MNERDTRAECPTLPEIGEIQMKTTTLPVGKRGVDTIIALDAEKCERLRNAGMTFVVRYLTSLSKDELAAILGSGLALSLVTYANSFDPSDEIAKLRTLGIPLGTVVWLDVEGVTADPVTLQQRISTWARAVKAAGYEPGGYFGSQQLLTSVELFALPITRYWHSCSRVVDRFGIEAGPQCGWVMIQLHPPNLTIAGVIVDVDVIQKDYRGREVTFVCAA